MRRGGPWTHRGGPWMRRGGLWTCREGPWMHREGHGFIGEGHGQSECMRRMECAGEGRGRSERVRRIGMDHGGMGVGSGLGGACGRHRVEKTTTPAHLCLAVTPLAVSTASHPRLIYAALSFCPLTCLAPSQHAAAIPDASHVPFMCPSPSHNLTHTPLAPSMRPDALRRTPPLLDAPPSQTHPAPSSCAADQLQFLLTSNGISFYFPSILLFQLFSSLSLAIASLLVNIMNITMTSL